MAIPLRPQICYATSPDVYSTVYKMYILNCCVRTQLATSVTHLTAFFLDHLGKTVHCTGLDFNEARDDGVALASAGPYTNLYTSLQTDNHASTSSVHFYRSDALPDAQPTASKSLKASWGFGAYLHTNWHLDSSSHLATTDMGWKLGELCRFGGGRARLHLTQCGQGRGLPGCQVSSWSIQPFGHNTPTSQTGQTDRQDGTDRQRCDSIGQTVLQTVAQEWQNTAKIVKVEIVCTNLIYSSRNWIYETLNEYCSQP